MKINKGLLLTIGAGIAISEYSRYMKLYESYSIGGKNFKFSNKGVNLVLDFQTEFINDSDKSINITNVSGNIFYSGRKIGEFTTAVNVNCKAKATTLIPTSVLIDSGSLINSLAAINKSSDKTILIEYGTRLKFTIAGLISLPVHITTKTSLNVQTWISNILKTWESLKR